MYRIGIDLGGTNIAIGLVTDDGVLIRKDSIPTNVRQTGEALAEDMAEFTARFLEAQHIGQEAVRSIGIGCPGVSDNEKGLLLLTVNLPFKNTNIREIFLRRFPQPVQLANDANCAALAEVRAGAAKGYQTSITITLGTGVGGGIIIDGKIYTGFNFAAGELGHMVIHTGGELCGCGRKGCLEAYASATALIRETKKAAQRHPESLIHQLCEGDLNKINAKTAFDAKRAGDPTGIQLVENFTIDLAEGLISYINIFQPEIILIGGGISKEGEYLLAPLREYVFRYAYGNDFLPRTRIEKAVLGNDAGIIGAAML